MADLPTNLKDDILDSSVNTRRKYRMIENPDGTVEFEDVTEYSQVGDEYGAGLINETNKQVNARVKKAVVVRDLDTIGAITQPGFIPDALALKDVNDSLNNIGYNFQILVDKRATTSSQNITVSDLKNFDEIKVYIIDASENLFIDGSESLSVSLFRQKVGTTIMAAYGSATSSAIVKYVNDTTISVESRGNYGIMVAGVKY